MPIKWWMDKQNMAYYTMEYCSVIHKNEALVHATAHMKLSMIMKIEIQAFPLSYIPSHFFFLIFRNGLTKLWSCKDWIELVIFLSAQSSEITACATTPGSRGGFKHAELENIHEITYYSIYRYQE